MIEYEISRLKPSGVHHASRHHSPTLLARRPLNYLVLGVFLFFHAVVPGGIQHASAAAVPTSSSFWWSRQSTNNRRPYRHNNDDDDDYYTRHTQRLLIISLDGFRHDFVEAYNLKHLASFVQESSRAAYLSPQFTTQAFPNHWSMATGAYVESHGIVANKFYDPHFNEFFQEHNTELKWWNATEPFWVTSVRHGLKTGVYHWPGSETLFAEDPNDLYTHIPYNDNTPFAAKLNQSLRWLLDEDFRLVCVYHNQPDAIAHKYGLNSREFNVTLAQLDAAFGTLLARLKSSGLYTSDNFNVMVVSDHGMSAIKKNVFVSDYFDEHDAHIWSFSRNLIHLRPIVALDVLLAKVAKIPGITVTLKSRMPDRLHYRDSARIGEVIISALEGVGFIYMSGEPMQFDGKVSPVLLTYEQKKKLLVAVADKASHGYDTIYPNMRGVFVAHGAMFKRRYQPDVPVENVDVYALVCHVLDLGCEARNASLQRVRHLLRRHDDAHDDDDQLGGGYGELSSSSSSSSRVVSGACRLVEVMFRKLFNFPNRSSPPVLDVQIEIVLFILFYMKLFFSFSFN